jgi:hypothetical protein
LLIAGDRSLKPVEGLKVVRRSAHRLQRLVEELGVHEDGKSLVGNMRLERVDVTAAVDEEIASFLPLSRQLYVPIHRQTTGEATYAQADRIKLGHAVGILLDNATRHSIRESRFASP